MSFQTFESSIRILQNPTLTLNQWPLPTLCHHRLTSHTQGLRFLLLVFCLHILPSLSPPHTRVHINSPQPLCINVEVSDSSEVPTKHSNVLFYRFSMRHQHLRLASCNFLLSLHILPSSSISSLDFTHEYLSRFLLHINISIHPHPKNHYDYLFDVNKRVYWSLPEFKC